MATDKVTIVRANKRLSVSLSFGLIHIGGVKISSSSKIMKNYFETKKKKQFLSSQKHVKITTYNTNNENFNKNNLNFPRFYLFSFFFREREKTTRHIEEDCFVLPHSLFVFISNLHHINSSSKNNNQMGRSQIMYFRNI